MFNKHNISDLSGVKIILTTFFYIINVVFGMQDISLQQILLMQTAKNKVIKSSLEIDKSLY